MSDLNLLPNIGNTLAHELMKSGIASTAQLQQAGSIQAAALLEKHGFSVCRSKLCALEGAIQGIRWHLLPADDRARLWEVYAEHESAAATD